MKRIKNSFLFCAFCAGAAIIMSSCNKQITEKQPDPNRPATVTPQLIVGTILTQMSGSAGPNSVGALGGVNSWDLVHGWNQYHCQNYDYYGNNIYAWTDNSTEQDNGASNVSDGPFNSYLVLKNVVQMENIEKSIGGGSVNVFEAIGRFVKAYYFYNLTMLMGDVPLTTALDGLGNLNTTPTYTSQEQVFEYVLNQLDTANSDFASLISTKDATLTPFASQDIYYSAKLGQWQKLVNSFKIRVLVELSNKASDANLNIPARFAAVVGNSSQYPIFTSQADDLQFNYNPGQANTFSVYPFNPSNFGSIAGRFNMAYTYVNACTSLNDARVFMTCDPAWKLVGKDPNPAQYQYFVGASTGLDMGTMYGNATAGDYALIGRARYYSTFTGDPNVLVGYKELLFNIAEGIERGWASPAAAETYYKQGILESMHFYGLNENVTNYTATFLPPTASAITGVEPYPFTFDFNNYYSQPSVKLNSTASTAIQQIVLQKYIAMFETSGYEPYYNWRRTGVPSFQGGSGVGNNGVIPIRWAYPVTEQAQNSANWSTALKNQGFSADDLNQKMWVLQ